MEPETIQARVSGNPAGRPRGSGWRQYAERIIRHNHSAGDETPEVVADAYLLAMLHANGPSPLHAGRIRRPAPPRAPGDHTQNRPTSPPAEEVPQVPAAPVAEKASQEPAQVRRIYDDEDDRGRAGKTTAESLDRADVWPAALEQVLGLARQARGRAP